VGVLAGLAARGVPIVGTEPSCLFTLVDEYPQLVRSASARRIADRSMMLETFLRGLLDREPEALTFGVPETALLYHGHCHQKAMVGSGDAVALLKRVWGERASEINSGCCGMAGAFGHEVEHYEISRAMGEQRLFPAVRARGEAEIAVSGFSCRTQIEHHTGAPTRTLVERLAELIR
jgi:Fe-S oxidoreductase